MTQPAFRSNDRVAGRTAVGLAIALLLGACGGGGSGTTASTASTTSTTSTEPSVLSTAPALTMSPDAAFTQTRFNGTVVDGPIEGAQVFLDLNGNQAHDEGEPISSPTDAAGTFSLVADRLTSAQAATTMLVTIVPDTARDADDAGLDLRAAGRRGFTLMTPASA